MTQYKHIYFDLDDTLTPSRTPMLAEHIPLFMRLCKEKDVIVVSGAQESQMKSQLTPETDGMYYLLTQNGNLAMAPDGAVLWKESFSDEQVAAIMHIIELLKADANMTVANENDLIENRGSQISYSVIGHHESLENKRAYDPDGARRRALLGGRRAEVDDLTKHGIEITIGGTTCFDIFLAGRNKGFNVKRLADQLGWNIDECVYLGDALQPGRNDASVIGVMPTRAVKDHNDTFAFIASELLTPSTTQ